MFAICTRNPTEASRLRHTDTNVDLIFKLVFCESLKVVLGTNVGFDPTRFSFVERRESLTRSACGYSGCFFEMGGHKCMLH